MKYSELNLNQDKATSRRQYNIVRQGEATLYWFKFNSLYKGFSYISPLIGDENVPQLFAIQPTGRRPDVGLDRLWLSIANWAGGDCRYVAVAISFAALTTSASAGVFLYLFLPDRQRGKLCRLGLDNDSLVMHRSQHFRVVRRQKRLPETLATQKLRCATFSGSLFNQPNSRY